MKSLREHLNEAMINEKAFDPAKFSMDGFVWYFKPAESVSGGKTSGLIHKMVAGRDDNQGYWVANGNNVSASGPNMNTYKHVLKMDMIFKAKGVDFAAILTKKRKYDVVVQTKSGSKNGDATIVSDGTKPYKV